MIVTLRPPKFLSRKNHPDRSPFRRTRRAATSPGRGPFAAKRHSFAGPGHLDVVFGIHIPPRGVYMSFSAIGRCFRHSFAGGRQLPAGAGQFGA